MMGWLGEEFEHGRVYTEKEVKEMLAPHAIDHATLRRYLVDTGILDAKHQRTMLARIAQKFARVNSLFSSFVIRPFFKSLIAQNLTHSHPRSIACGQIAGKNSE